MFFNIWNNSEIFGWTPCGVEQGGAAAVTSWSRDRWRWKWLWCRRGALWTPWTKTFSNFQRGLFVKITRNQFFCAQPTWLTSRYFLFRFLFCWPPHSLSVASHKEIVPLPISSIPRPRQDLHWVESRTRSDQQQLSVCTAVHPTTGHDRAIQSKNTRTRLRSRPTSHQKQ